MTPIEALARDIATQAHAGQVDKAGQPYIGHVERVVERLDDPLDRAVAWLHDVIEDTEWTWEKLYQLRPMGYGSPTWRSLMRDVLRLTHRQGEPRADYYARIRGSSRAVRVKLADLADNSDPARLALLDEATRARLVKKYDKAREALSAREPGVMGQ